MPASDPRQLPDMSSGAALMCLQLHQWSLYTAQGHALTPSFPDISIEGNVALHSSKNPNMEAFSASISCKSGYESKSCSINTSWLMNLWMLLHAGFDQVSLIEHNSAEDHNRNRPAKGYDQQNNDVLWPCPHGSKHGPLRSWQCNWLHLFPRILESAIVWEQSHDAWPQMLWEPNRESSLSQALKGISRCDRDSKPPPPPPPPHPSFSHPPKDCTVPCHMALLQCQPPLCYAMRYCALRIF